VPNQHRWLVLVSIHLASNSEYFLADGPSATNQVTDGGNTRCGPSPRLDGRGLPAPSTQGQLPRGSDLQERFASKPKCAIFLPRSPHWVRLENIPFYPGLLWRI